MGAMRSCLFAAVVVASAAACAHDEHPSAALAPRAPSLAELPPAPEVADTQSYVVGDSLPGRSRPVVLGLGTQGKGGGQGLVLDGLRVVVSSGDGPVHLRAARDVTEPALEAADRIPSWLGGGFLFRSGDALYVSPTFDGALRPLVALPGEIERVSFGPKSLLVRGQNGERWAIDARTGALAPLNPPGLVDVAALPDGRAAALTEFGGVMVSLDAGAHWTDVASRLPSGATAVAVVDDALYVTVAAPPSGGPNRAVRVDPGGQLVTFDRPPATKPPELRPRDPRWTGSEPPLRRAVRLGVPFDETSAILVSEGSVVRVDLRTGALLSVAPGRLPPDATCEAVRAQDDVVLACTRTSGPSFVASHLASDKAPLIEQTFAATGVFYAGDDGALAFGGPCTRAKPSSLVVCVRGAEGSWQEHDLEARGADGGAGVSGVDVVRWVPRTDGGAYGLVSTPKRGVIDARTGELRPWQLDAIPQGTHDLFERPRWQRHDVTRVVDRTWSFTASGSLRGWANAATVEVSIDGVVRASPFNFDHLAPSGPFALAASNDGRFWQTVDRGSTWVEVAPPLVTRADPKAARPGRFVDTRLCSAVGCDLGAWYRVGWAADPPAGGPPPALAEGAPHLGAARLPSLTCAVKGDARVASALHTERSPDDLALGAARLPVADDNSGEELVRIFHGRGVNNLPHGVSVASDSGEESPRVLLSGFATTAGDERIVVQGPNKDPLALRRALTFLAPFDPAATIHRTGVAVSDIVRAGHAIGLGTLDVLQDDPTEIAGFAPLLDADPASPSDLLFTNALGVVGIVRGSGRVRVTMRAKPQSETSPLSAAALPGEETAFLEVDSDGNEHVRKWGAGGVSDLFDVPPPPEAGAYPANPDGLAVGARGDLAVVRTPSGGSPPSAEDPALLLVPGARPSPLAPWSTLVTADDPACRSDPGGYRAIVAATRPWLQVAGPGFRAQDEASTLLRVRWTASRVCLEAVEVRVDDAKVASQERTGDGRSARVNVVESTVPTWVVARFAPSVAARQGIVAGLESRQPLECSLARAP